MARATLKDVGGWRFIGYSIVYLEWKTFDF